MDRIVSTIRDGKELYIGEDEIRNLAGTSRNAPISLLA